MWYVHVPLGMCDHGALIHKSNMAEDGEDTPEFEYLFTPFSVFTVRRVVWSDSPDNLNPHEIHIIASADNKSEPDDLLTAPWC